MSKLSLTTRKNIKDAEPKLQANLKKLTTASGITFETEFDWTVLAPIAETKGYKDRVGEVVYDWYLAGLASAVETFCKDPIQKESFVEAFGSKKLITLAIIPTDQINDEDGPYYKDYRYAYNWVSSKDGALQINVPEERFVSNCSNTGDNLSKACSGDSGPMSVATRKNIKDQEATRKKHLTRIQKATGIDFDVDVDWVVFAQGAKDRGYEDRVGDVIYDWYIGGLATQIETFVKDPIQKESLVESFGEKKVIAFAMIPTEQINDEDGPYYKDYRYAYNWVQNKDGVLVINIPSERFVSNCSNTGDNLSKACSGDSPMSVATRKNIADNQKKLQTHQKTLKTATGVDFEVEVDWPQLAALSKEKGYEDRVGDVVYDWYIGGLAGAVKKFVEDPIQKEAFLEAFGEKHSITITIIPTSEINDEDGPYYKDFRYAYNWIHNKDGVLSINVPSERFVSNCSNTGDNLSKACSSGDSPMSVATRKNIKDQEATRKKNMTRIQKATGIEFELDIDWVVFAQAAKDRGYEDRVGEVIYNWYLGGLADNLEKLCKDEMCKEAVGEACEKKVIAFVMIPNEEMESNYQKCIFVDGVLQVQTSTEKFVSNCSNTGNDIESRL